MKRRSRGASRRGAALDVASPFDHVGSRRAIALELVGGRGHYERVLAAVLDAKVSVWIATANVKELMVEGELTTARGGFETGGGFDTRGGEIDLAALASSTNTRAGARTGGASTRTGSATESAYAAKQRRGKRRQRDEYVSVLSRLDELAARGVELRLLHAEIPSRPFRAEIAQHPRLVRGGLALRRCPRVHMKAVIVDGALLYLGSANWTGAGLGAKGSGRRNFELGIVTDDAPLLDQVQALYERVWTGGECGSCRLREECPGPIDELSDQPAAQLVKITKKRSRARSRKRDL